MTDADYIDRTLFLAERGRGRTSPNPMVGAVVVSQEGVVVGQGFHERAGEPHAEVHALDMAGRRARGAVLYCTLEPCCHVGRTGPCVGRIVEAGITRVVAADRRIQIPPFSGRGFAYLRAHGVDVANRRWRRTSDAAQSTVFYAHAGATAVRHHEGGDESGWLHREWPGAADKSDIHGSESARTSLPCRSRRHGVGVGTVLVDDPAVDRTRGLSGKAADASDIRSAVAHAPGARVLSTLDAGPGGHRHDIGWRCATPRFAAPLEARRRGDRGRR